MQQSCHSDRQPACSRKQQPTPDQQFPGRHSEDQSQPDGFRPVLDVLSQQFCDRGQHLSSDRMHELIVEFADRRIDINADNDQTQRMNRMFRFSHRHDDREYNELVSPWLKSMLIQRDQPDRKQSKGDLTNASNFFSTTNRTDDQANDQQAQQYPIDNARNIDQVLKEWNLWEIGLRCPQLPSRDEQSQTEQCPDTLKPNEPLRRSFPFGL